MEAVHYEVNERFEDFIFDWDYPTYLLVGGYGSGKSHAIATKLILKALIEKRKILVVREVYETIKESCFDLLMSILEELDLLAEFRGQKGKVEFRTSPLQFMFPNGSRIIFRGMDKPVKLKSIHDVSIVWLEEGSEVKYDGYKEIQGRLRHPTMSLHVIISSNPVDEETWIYQRFFKRTDDDGQEVLVLDDEKLYRQKTLVKKNVYYHHSTVDDNVFVPRSYIRALEEMQEYDKDLYRVARQGRFGINGRLVLPQFKAEHTDAVLETVSLIPPEFHFIGFDFGFETSYNAIVKMAVDDKNKILYIYDEYYRNNMTDDQTVAALDVWDPKLRKKRMVADNEDPKAIRFYQQSGFIIRGCRNKYAGSRLSSVRKIKRFRKIICASRCRNVIRELRTLTYDKDKRSGKLVYDRFNIDPHTFSAIWYGLDTYDVADIKHQGRNPRKGEVA